MKKLILTTFCAAATLSGFAQGTMQFQNGNTSPVYIASSYATQYAAGLKATSNQIGGQSGSSGSTSTGVVDIALLWGTSAGSVDTLAGVIKMGTTAGSMGGNNNFQVTGTSPGDLDWFEVVAWDNSYGDTLAGEAACLAAGGYWGSANSTAYGVVGGPLQFALGPNPSPGTVMFGSLATTGVFHYFALTSSPEPTTLALGGLGAAALLMFRRRK